ncbi:helix-turn-helix transcriptional regulator [uncultured Algimonas sp.]|uniref:helix-turn-helix domain-containing protein n=1 Tax=uncultured Algimonas sp. TaxID=1547920 RepID=UPI002611C247|nr:helix-turn-helix transcriptional regulator [uncultured Algimonas sp.]
MKKPHQSKPRNANAVDLHVGTRLRLRRLQLGMSQSALGDAVGVTFQQIQKYEKGKNRIGASRLWSFAEALEVPLQWFFEGLLPQREGQSVQPNDNMLQDFINTRDGFDFVEALNGIKSINVRRQLLLFARTLSDESHENKVKNRSSD